MGGIILCLKNKKLCLNKFYRLFQRSKKNYEIKCLKSQVQLCKSVPRSRIKSVGGLQRNRDMREDIYSVTRKSENEVAKCVCVYVQPVSIAKASVNSPLCSFRLSLFFFCFSLALNIFLLIQRTWVTYLRNTLSFRKLFFFFFVTRTSRNIEREERYIRK